MSGQPDFDALGQESLWPAEEWRSAWNGLPDQHRAALWPKVVVLGSGYTRPTWAADAFVSLSRTPLSEVVLPDPNPFPRFHLFRKARS